MLDFDAMYAEVGIMGALLEDGIVLDLIADRFVL